MQIKVYCTIFILIITFPLSSSLLAGQQAELLQYQVKEAGQEAYLSRIFVTPQAMRIDQGEHSDGFILYDRRQNVIYSVDYEERSILVIQPEAVKDETGSVAPEIITQDMHEEEAPEVAGQKPQHWRMLVNGQPCQEALTISGVMKESLAAQKAYLQLLAVQHKRTLAAIPIAYRDQCADAIQVYAPNLLWDKGLPLRLWDINGNQQVLVDFSNAVPVNAEQFNLPDDFRRIPMQ